MSNTKIKDYQVVVDTSNYNGVLTTEDSLDKVIEKVDSLNKNDIGLNNVDNTSDADKPVSSATQLALDDKANQTDLDTLSGTVTTLGTDKEDKSNKGVANGYASLDSNGLVPASQLPSYVDDVLEYADLTSFPLSGETGKIYIDASVSKTYRWSGTQYVVMADTGVTSLDGQGGDITLKTVNGNDLKGTGDIVIESGVTSVDSQTGALTTKTINGEAILGTGDIVISAGGGDVYFSPSNPTTLTTTGSSETGDNNVVVGYQASYSNTTGSGIVAIGYGAAKNSTTAGYFTSIGWNSLNSLTTGGNNTAVGKRSGEKTTTGTLNVFIGDDSGRNITTGNYNVCLGYNSNGGTTSSGSSNTAVGTESLRQNTASNNTAVGYQSSYSNTTGTSNTALGHSSLYNNTTGNKNVSIGYLSCYNNTIQSNNTAIGCSSMEINDGAANVAIGSSALKYGVGKSYNTAVGYNSQAGSYTFSTGGYNTSLGANSLLSVTTGSSNVAIGYVSLDANTTGTHNTAIGRNSLGLNTTGAYNTALGSSALSGNISYTNTTGVGYNSQVTGDNQVQLGDSATTTYVYGTVQNRSDRRDKLDIRDTSLGLDFINKVRPVEYRWDLRDSYNDTITKTITKEVEKEVQKYNIVEKEEDYIEDGVIKTRIIEEKEYLFETVEEIIEFIDVDEEGNKFINTKTESKQVPVMETITETVEEEVEESVKLEKDGSKAGKRFHQGVIAQEIEDIITETGIDFGGFQRHNYNENGKDVLSIGYDEFIAPLIKAVQELSKEVEDLKSQLNK